MKKVNNNIQFKIRMARLQHHEKSTFKIISHHTDVPVVPIDGINSYNRVYSLPTNPHYANGTYRTFNGTSKPSKVEQYWSPFKAGITVPVIEIDNKVAVTANVLYCY